MHKALLVTFWQFESALTEWHDASVIWRHRSEAFSMYLHGHSVQFVAGELARMEHEISGAEAE